MNFKHLAVPFIAKTVLRRHVLESLNVLSMQKILEEKLSYTAMLVFELSLCAVHQMDCVLLAVESSSLPVRQIDYAYWH